MKGDDLIGFQVTRRLWVMAVSLLCAILILIATIVQILRADKKPDLTMEEAKQEVLNQYEGEIVSVELNGSSYRVVLQSQTGRYELNVDKEHSGITAIRSIGRYEGSPPDLATSPSADVPVVPVVPFPSPSPNPAVLLNKDEATKLALSKVEGTVKDVDIENAQGKWYYFVEIDTPDGREADVQLNAASGVIISVTWDDDDD